MPVYSRSSSGESTIVGNMAVVRSIMYQVPLHPSPGIAYAAALPRSSSVLPHSPDHAGAKLPALCEDYAP